MKRSLDEKMAYNRKQDTLFASGYVFGVNMYREYPKSPAQAKADINSIVALAKENARNGEQWDKGILCGMRDAANERKSKQRK